MKVRATINRERVRWSDAVAAAQEEARSVFPDWKPLGISLNYIISGGPRWKATLRLEGEVE